MKKIVLLVASILATLHSIASRSSNDSSNPLILSPSDGIYNHGSHASHRSHYSAPVSQTSRVSSNSPTTQQTSYSTKVELDSLGELSEKQKKYAIEKVSTDWKENKEKLHLKAACYAYVLSIKTQNGSKVTSEKQFPENRRSSILPWMATL